MAGKLFVTGASYRDDLQVPEGLVLDGLYCGGALGRKRSCGPRDLQQLHPADLFDPVQLQCEDDRSLAVGRVRAAAGQLCEQVGELNNAGVLRDMDFPYLPRGLPCKFGSLERPFGCSPAVAVTRGACYRFRVTSHPTSHLAV